MVIYLEGPDGSGKTSLTQQIEYQCKLLSIPCTLAEPSINTNPSKPNRISKEKLMLALYEMLNDYKRVYILDRGPISDCIYRLFDNYEPVASLLDIANILSLYKDNLLLIYCNNSSAERYMLERGDDNKVAIEKHHKISYAYDMIMNLLWKYIWFIKYDFTAELPLSTERHVVEWLKEVFNLK